MATKDGRKIAVLFPGQGSQYVGMGREFLDTDPAAAELMALAEEASGFPLRTLCLDGPMAELTRTVNLQPALTVTNLICWQALAAAGVRPDVVAGHSLGEYSALAAAGVLSPADTLRLVTERGRLMEREAAAHPGSMRAVVKLGLAEVEEILAAVADQGAIAAANHNSEQQVVISGQVEALDAASALVAERGGKAIPLKVSGAWHSELIAGAVPDFAAAMERITFKPPQLDLLFNVTAAVERDPAAIRAIMARQIASMVRWYDIVGELIARQVRVFVEVGPKTVLTGLVKKIVPADYACEYLQFDTPAGLAEVADALGG